MCQSCSYLFLCPPTKLECWLGLAWPGLSFLPFIPLLYTLCFKNAQGSFLIIFCLTLLKLSCYSKKATFLSFWRIHLQMKISAWSGLDCIFFPAYLFYILSASNMSKTWLHTCKNLIPMVVTRAMVNSSKNHALLMCRI